MSDTLALMSPADNDTLALMSPADNVYICQHVNKCSSKMSDTLALMSPADNVHICQHALMSPADNYVNMLINVAAKCPTHSP